MALITNISFIDPQGTPFTEATFGVSYATQYSNESINLRRDMADMTTMVEDTHLNKNVNVQFYYWADEVKRLEGKSPYILANMNDGIAPPTMSFDFEATGVEYDGMTTEQMCLHYLQTYVLV